MMTPMSTASTPAKSPVPDPSRYSHATVEVLPFFDPATGTVTYLVWARQSRRAAIIDPVLDYDFRAGRTSTTSADRVLSRLRDEGLALDWILETHAHADHLSAAAHVQREAGGHIVIGRRIQQVQSTFKALYNLERGFVPDGRQFDRLLDEGDTLPLGEAAIRALWVPGHTPADMAYAVDNAVFVGDTLFMPDVGTARADFPGGDAAQLFRSAQRLLSLPPETVLYVCHDYPPDGRAPSWRTTVAAQRAANIHVRDGIGEEAFVDMRRRRDATLEMPTLILPSIQVNVRAGHLPPPDDNGVRYLRIPLNSL
jgi:glyoxylase-like metal-dependent hydrolase (beta-lactamase superfamily II)